MTEILTHDQIVSRAYYLVTSMLGVIWQPKAKRELLEATAPYLEQIMEAEGSAYRRSSDETLTDFERIVASRDEGILHIAGSLLTDLKVVGLRDKRLTALLTPFE
jgi:hypothetical protein